MRFRSKKGNKGGEIVSIVDDFMSEVIDFNETEKEETILFLAEALVCNNYEFLKKISPKVQNTVLPFLTNVAIRTDNVLFTKEKGGEKDELGTRLKDNQRR